MRKKKRQGKEPVTDRRVIKIWQAYYLNLLPEFVEANRHPAAKGGEKQG